MSDQATSPVPAPAATPTPAQASATASMPSAPAKEQPKAEAPKELTGIAKAMQAFTTVEKPKEVQTPKTPNEAPKAPIEKPSDKPSDKPDARAEVDWEKVDPKIKGAHFKFKREMESKVSEYESKIKAIESKPKETAADAKLVEQYQTQIKELEQKIASSDYRNSPEFKRNFVDKINGSYKRALESVTRMNLIVPAKDGGEPTTRPATKADFDRIMMMSPEEQDVATDAFGSHKARVTAFIMDLNNTQNAAQDAINEYAQKAELTAKEREIASAKERSDYERHLEQSKKELLEQYPQFFGEVEGDDEINTTIQEGYRFVDEALKAMDKMSLDERAAHNAVIRARAASAPRMALELSRRDAKIKELESEIAKYRKSDPGSGGEHHETASVASEVPKGIEAAVAAFRNK